MDQLNIAATVVAAVSSFLLGALWYSPKVLGRLWNREAGRGLEAQGRHAPTVFAVSFAFNVVAAAAFALWLGPEPDLGAALAKATVAGACFVASSLGMTYQFASLSWLMWVIDGGYHVARFLLFGLVLGLWPN